MFCLSRNLDAYAGGRTQRVFIEYLAATAGYHLDFSKVTDKEMIEASALAFACKFEANRIISHIFLLLSNTL